MMIVDDKHLVFDRKKLEELMERHTVEPTDEFIIAEIERCKDPVYFYNHYWMVIDKDGNAVSPKPITYEEYEERQNVARMQIQNLKRRRPILIFHGLPYMISKEKIEFKEKPVPKVIERIEDIDLKQLNQPFYKFNSHRGGNKNKRNRRY